MKNAKKPTKIEVTKESFSPSNSYLNRLRRKVSKKHLVDLVEVMTDNSAHTIHEAYLKYKHGKKLAEIVENYLH